jgi:porphobilinogen synthase
MSFPVHRTRRLRRTENIRRMVRETRLSPADLVYPLFVTAEENVRRPLAALPGMHLLSGSHLVDEVRELRNLGIPSVLMFGVPDESGKDDDASLAASDDGPVQLAIRQIKEAVPELCVISDLCFCEYKPDNHCGFMRDGEIDNDLTLEHLRKAAVSLANAGSDMIAPSSMMDGSVQAIRSALDQAGRENVLTMPYSAKFASALYGPFKGATRSAPRESLHATHQLDPANSRQALVKIAQDIDEGADIVIVKPALGYLDVVRETRNRFDVPIAAYSVSSEYTMLLSASGGDPEARDQLVGEALTCIKRAGTDMIITYFAKEAARLFRARG